MSESVKKEILGYIHQTETFGAVDGPGIRFVYFLQGCALRCLYCHNPDAIPNKGGKPITVDEAVNQVLDYKLFIKNGGITFSGGEPLMQAEFIREVSLKLREQGIHVAIDTSGIMDIEDENVKNAIDTADLILLDIKAYDSDVCKDLTGRDNINAFKTLDYCESTNKAVWIRHVLLKGYTLHNSQLEKLAQKLKTYKCIEKIELLPFHKLGEPKWESIGQEYKLIDVPATTKDEKQEVQNIFSKYGFDVQ